MYYMLDLNDEMSTYIKNPDHSPTQRSHSDHLVFFGHTLGDPNGRGVCEERTTNLGGGDGTPHESKVSTLSSFFTSGRNLYDR